MGTRADFYVGRGENAEWLGSIGWDGYPDGIPEEVLNASDDAAFREAVTEMLKKRDDGTTPEMGWPWPWETSATSDYAYAIDAGKVHASCFGHNWFDPTSEQDDDGDYKESDVKAVLPNMKDVQKVNFGSRSGMIFVTVK